MSQVDFSSSSRTLPLRENYFEFYLPGLGEKPRNCRGWLPSWYCPDCGTPHLRKGDCKQAKCPDCYKDWRYIASQNIMKHILSYIFEKPNIEIKRTKRVRHFSLSPPKEDYPELYNGSMINYDDLENYVLDDFNIFHFVLSTH